MLEEVGEPGTYPRGAVIFEQGGTSVSALQEVRGLVVPLRAFRGFLMDQLLSRRLRESDAQPVSGS